MSKYNDGSIDFGPFDDDYRGFDIRDDETARGPLILALALGVLLVFGAVVWNTYRQGVRGEGAGLPTVIADAQPYKRAPEDPGGQAIPDTDKRFYDQMDASQRTEIAEAPINTVPSNGPDVLQGGPPIELRPTANGQNSGSDPDTGMPNAVADQVRELAELDERTEATSGVETAALGKTNIPTTRTPKPSAVMQPMFAFSEAGKFSVQIAAFRSEAAAEDAWGKVTKKSPDLYRGAGKRIQRADLGAKGVFYRLRVGGFDERSEATAFCSALKDAGNNCIVVTQ
jgi:cell division septation protein DedD